MDPLSVIASSIAVATLAASTCNAFADLRSICKTLPGRLHALNNEVADIEVVLRQVAEVVQERAALPLSENEQAHIPQLLKQADAKLVELKSIVEEFNAFCLRTTSKIPLFRAHVWKKEQGKLEGLQEDIKTVKSSLNILLGATNSRDMMHIRLQLQTLSTVTSNIPETQDLLRDSFLNSLTHHHRSMEERITEVFDERISKVDELIKTQSSQLEFNQNIQIGPFYRGPRRVHKRRTSSTTSDPRVQAASSAQSDGVGVRVSRSTSTCRTGCACACHGHRRSSTPAFVDRVLGQLFVGYVGLPVLGPKCDKVECERGQNTAVSMEYWFPLGFFWSQIVRLQLGYQANLGPQFNLTTMRRVPDNARCVTFAMDGNIDGLKDLFKNGLASPWDVSSTRGYTIARWAMYAKQYKTVKFLVQQGADVDYRPIANTDNNPRHKANDFVLQGGLSPEDVENLRCLTAGSDWIEEQNFSNLHKIICGILLRSLEEEISLHPEDINHVDNMGRTPLHWAAARGDTQAVALLLSHGADTDKMDSYLSTPLFPAADRNHAVCVRLLLEAGAETDPILPPGVLRGGPLNLASRNASDPMVLKTLLDFGANPESCGVDGRTPLIHAARTDNISFAILLLDYGADINASSIIDETPLIIAIKFNSHNVLQLLLDRWVEYSTCPRLKGPHMLQIAAVYADIETLRILAATNHFKLKYDNDFCIGDFATRLETRHDLVPELVDAFEDLLSVIRIQSEMVESHESLMESGLLCRTNSGLGLEHTLRRDIDIDIDAEEDNTSENSSSVDHFEMAMEDLNLDDVRI